MAREALAAKKARLSKIIEALHRTYPDAHCELNYGNPLQLLIATILSAQCTDKQVNIVTEPLFKRCRTAQDFASLSLPELERSIQRLGLFRNKAKSIRVCCQALIEHHDSEVPASIDALTELAGVGRKTANVVLGNAFDQNEGVVVDTHVARLSQRLRLSREKTPEKIERDLQKIVPRAQWTMISHWLIWHGRRRCPARNPRCDECEIAHLCPSATTTAPPRSSR